MYFKDPLLPWFSTKAEPEKQICDALFIFKMVLKSQSGIPGKVRQEMRKKNINIKY